MTSNDSRELSVPTNSSRWNATLLNLCVVGSIVILFGGVCLEAHKVTSDYEVVPIPLPGAKGVVTLDYFAYDRSTGKLWVPASNTGSVDIIDDGTDSVSQVTGFKTGEFELRGRKLTLGPTAVSVGDRVVYIGNRGDSSLCVIDAQTLKRENVSRLRQPQQVLRQRRTLSFTYPRQKSYGSRPAHHLSEFPLLIKQSRCLMFRNRVMLN